MFRMPPLLTPRDSATKVVNRARLVLRLTFPAHMTALVGAEALQTDMPKPSSDAVSSRVTPPNKTRRRHRRTLCRPSPSFRPSRPIPDCQPSLYALSRPSSYSSTTISRTSIRCVHFLTNRVSEKPGAGERTETILPSWHCYRPCLLPWLRRSHANRGST